MPKPIADIAGKQTIDTKYAFTNKNKKSTVLPASIS